MMIRKKIFSLFVLILFIGIFSANTCKAQDDWADMDPGGEVPISGAVYFIVAALAVGAKKLYDVRKITKE
jgi:hypothetical protein